MVDSIKAYGKEEFENLKIMAYGRAHFEDFRKTLLEQYHSQTTNHTGYILAVVVGLLAVVSQISSFFTRAYYLIPFLLIVSAVVGSCFYFSCRLAYWTYFASRTLDLKVEQVEDAYKQAERAKPAVPAFNTSYLGFMQNCVFNFIRNYKGHISMHDRLARLACCTNKLIAYSLILIAVVFVGLFLPCHFFLHPSII